MKISKEILIVIIIIAIIMIFVMGVIISSYKGKEKQRDLDEKLNQSYRSGLLDSNNGIVNSLANQGGQGQLVLLYGNETDAIQVGLSCEIING